ncbi:uncharacterized protein TNCT_596491 [Trichonephila clavata]|uniref:Uncharacterized protein n=1 Tax=Trichonephila clavata TaxID=2740835 RepID=A0A8X6JEW1_TRICU|nr:uncharacterized protein TNCT_596491 [Trichonephila clavata]
MISCNPSLPTLQQMSFVVIAVKISTDQEVKDLMKKYGPVSFVIPSKEIRIFLNKKPPESNHREMYRLYISEIKYTLLSTSPTPGGLRDFATPFDGFHFNTYGFAANDLPSTKWEELVSRKISSLGLSIILRKELMPIIRCICLEIDIWQKYLKDNYIFEFVDIQRYFCWNSHGKIDKIKTAKSLINNENLPISERYNLARHYGFASNVIFLWEKMNRMEKDNAKSIGDRAVQQVWFEYRATGTVENSIQICKCAIGNPLNLRAFFSLLMPTEKVRWYKTFISIKVIDYEDLHSCLSLLEKNEQEFILRKYSSKILEYYLVWPLQNEFLNVSKIIWPYMSIESYIDLLKFIIYERIMIGWKDFDYVELLKEFWRQTPDTFKELAKKEEIYQVVLLVINCELHKNFPNEVILENYKGNVLKFHHVGMNYDLKRKRVLVDPVRCPECQDTDIVDNITG